MKVLLVTVFTAVALVGSGCATRRYVRNTAAPIQAKVDEVGQETNQNGQSIKETRTQVAEVDERAQNGISAAKEQASTAEQDAKTADRHAGDAMNRANEARQASDQNGRRIDSLQQVVSNIDHYTLQQTVSVPFKFNRFRLTDDAKMELDKVADAVKADHTFEIAVEGYTDQIGSREYNQALSQRRADSVVHYLVAEHDIPIYRIHMIGLGELKPVEEGRNREANAKNRRVEIRVFSTDQATASLHAAGDATADRSTTPPEK